MDATNNLYFLETKPLTLEAACAVESALRLCPDKSVFIMNLGPGTSTEGAFEQKLKSEYTNLHTIKTDGSRYLAGSPFEGRWSTSGSEASLAAEILTVWQFGGGVISDNLILHSRRVFDSNDGYCEVDRQLLFCPVQCAAFAYDMLEAALKWKGSTDEEIVSRAVANFCGGGEKFVDSGCAGVHRLKSSSMCDTVASHCTFIRIAQLKAKNPDWQKLLKEHCPIILK
ncbi:hypothetical protein AAG570_011959 [Ranatra chinensis]|uniref:Uncharacterized protein n=1 Tax=Ranatra chinensis TaxID=642074 RepID=A0ABD0Z3Q4_9HEMI